MDKPKQKQLLDKYNTLKKNKYYVVILDTNLDKRFREIYEKYHEKKEGKLLMSNRNNPAIITKNNGKSFSAVVTT